MIGKINHYLRVFGIEVKKNRVERLAVIRAKAHFKGKEIVACEIGTFSGVHAKYMFKELNIKKLYIIDPYDTYEDYDMDGSSPHLKSAKREAHKLLKEYSDKIVWIEKFSEDAINDIKEELDFVYIDGNHYHPYVDNDIKNYFPKVRTGGIISGHDYNILWGDVMEAVFEFSKEIGRPASIGWGTDWLFIK